MGSHTQGERVVDMTFDFNWHKTEVDLPEDGTNVIVIYSFTDSGSIGDWGKAQYYKGTWTREHLCGDTRVPTYWCYIRRPSF